MEKVKKQARIAKTKLSGSAGWFRKHLAFSIVLLVVILAFIGSLIFVTVYYHDKAAPGTTIANINVGGQTKDQITSTVKKLINNMRLSLTYGGKSATASSNDLGVDIDVNKIADEAVKTGRRNPFATVFINKHFDLSGSYDQEKVKAFVSTNFPELTTDPVDPQIVYNNESNRYVVQAGAVGKSVELGKLYAKVKSLLKAPQLTTYEISTIDAQPSVSDQSAQETVDKINNTLSQTIQITNNGRVLWTIDPWTIADWATFELVKPEANDLDNTNSLATTESATGHYEIKFNRDKITGFVNDAVVGQLSNRPVNQKAITGANGEVYAVTSSGRNGQVPSNTDNVVGQIYDHITDGTSAQINMQTKDANYGTDATIASNGHWIEANLSTYEVKLYDGKNLVWSTNRTSHGKTSTPTITGLFKVWRKVEEQCMPNPPSTEPLCHIRKVTYFEASGYAFHEAWWMNYANGNVNKGISHGCINMFYEDAKRVYDWSTIGTPVWVHW
ncbi:MAG: L,D-transpeptidase family protein [Candidatus Saccharibacteria bacterium]|nr:L,D-transpeptidase family protein [Candidatus Saccharibacteria bacterium]